MAQQYPTVPAYEQYPYYPPPMAHSQQQAMRPAPGSYQSNVQNPPVPQSYLNPPRFEGHISGPSPNPFPQFSSASFPHEMFRHFASNPPPIPLPNPPPLPYSAAGFALFPPQTPAHQQQAPHYNHFIRPQNISAYGGARSSIMWAASEQQENNVHIGSTQIPLAHGNEPEINENASEDGEVGDDENDESADAFANKSSRTISQDEPAVPLDPDRWKIATQSRLDTAILKQQCSAEELLSRPADLPKQVQVDIEGVLSDGGESASSYNPPSASTPGSSHDLLDDLQTQISAAENPNVLAQTLPSRDPVHKSSSEMRELAKGALLSLAPHNIRLQDLLGEGIDEHILQELYNELGMTSLHVETVPQTTKSFQQQSLNHSSLESERTSQRTSQISQTSFPKPILELSKRRKEDVAGANLQAIKSTATSGNVSSTQPNSDAGIPASARPTPSPLLERKDRIAQLLAAKTGKLPANRITPETSSPVLAVKAVLSLSEAGERLRSANSVKAPSATDSTKPLSQSQSLSNTGIRSEPNQQTREIIASDNFAPHTEIKSENFHADQDASLPSSELFETGKALLSLPEQSELQRTSNETANVQLAPQISSLIPGLFMTSADHQQSEVEVQNQESLVPSSPQIKDANAFPNAAAPEHGTRSASDDTDISRRIQKRPLVADSFNEALQPPAKRAFERQPSSNVHTSSVAEHSSDDVSEGEIMETDEEPQSEYASNDNNRVRPTNPPDLPASVGSSRPPLEVSGDGVASSPSRVLAASSSAKVGACSSTGNLFLAKHQEIEAMRRKIAEAEERRKLKRSQSQLGSSRSSGQTTPVIPRAMPSLGSLSWPISVENSTAEDSMAARAAALKAEVLRKRSLRQKTLQEGIPDLDKDFQKTRSKLAEAQAKLAQLKAENERREAERIAALKQQEDIVAEALKLEEQLQQGLIGRRQYSDELHRLDGDGDAITTSTLPVSADYETTDGLTSGLQSPDLQGKTEVDLLHQEHLSAHYPPTESIDVNDSTAILLEELQTDIESAKTTTPQHESVPRSKMSPLDNGSLDRNTTPAALGQEPKQTTPGITGLSNDVSLSEDVEIASSTPRVKAALGDGDFGPDRVSAEESQSPMDLDDDSDGSASMSDSASDNYEPEEPNGHEVYPAEDESDEYDPEAATIPVQAPFSQVEEEHDGYEPAESVGFTKATASPNEEAKIEGPTISISGTSTCVDVREDGLQLTEANTLTKPQETPILVQDAVTVTSDIPVMPLKPSTHFIPYQSPLASLKSFRFNSAYVDMVKDGYRSMTYSYNIDPKRTLCPTELSGETCSDPTCEEQHFGQMTLADAKILEQLASAHDIADKVQRDRFLAGMKQVIADLRVRKVKEFSEVATELAAYRRRFREEQNPALLAPTS